MRGARCSCTSLNARVRMAPKLSFWNQSTFLLYDTWITWDPMRGPNKCQMLVMRRVPSRLCSWDDPAALLYNAFVHGSYSMRENMTSFDLYTLRSEKVTSQRDRSDISLSGEHLVVELPYLFVGSEITQPYSLSCCECIS